MNPPPGSPDLNGARCRECTQAARECTSRRHRGSRRSYGGNFHSDTTDNARWRSHPKEISLRKRLLALKLIPDLGHAPVVVVKNSKQLGLEVAAEFEKRLAALRDRIDEDAPSSTQAPDLDPETLTQPQALGRDDEALIDRRTEGGQVIECWDFFSIFWPNFRPPCAHDAPTTSRQIGVLE